MLQRKGSSKFSERNTKETRDFNFEIKGCSLLKDLSEQFSSIHKRIIYFKIPTQQLAINELNLKIINGMILYLLHKGGICIQKVD